MAGRTTAWARKNRERARAHERAYELRHPERFRALRRASVARSYAKHKANPEWQARKREYTKRYQAKLNADPERLAKRRSRRNDYRRRANERMRVEQPERYRAMIRKATAKTLLRQRMKRQKVDEAMSGGCVDCGEQDVRVLDFDHVRGKKTMGVSEMVSRNMSLEHIFNEIKKCEIRCANCHRRKTWERRAARV